MSLKDQYEINFESLSREVTNQAIQQGAEHADLVWGDWQLRAYLFLMQFIKTKSLFTCEEVVKASVNIVPPPPDNRAWGAIIRKAVIDGKISRENFVHAKGIKVHRTTVSMWRVKQ